MFPSSNDLIDVECVNCGYRTKAGKQYLGRTVQCPRCSDNLHIKPIAPPEAMGVQQQPSVQSSADPPDISVNLFDSDSDDQPVPDAKFLFYLAIPLVITGIILIIGVFAIAQQNVNRTVTSCESWLGGSGDRKPDGLRRELEIAEKKLLSLWKGPLREISDEFERQFASAHSDAEAIAQLEQVPFEELEGFTMNSNVSVFGNKHLNDARKAKMLEHHPAALKRRLEEKSRLAEVRAREEARLAEIVKPIESSDPRSAFDGTPVSIDVGNDELIVQTTETGSDLSYRLQPSHVTAVIVWERHEDFEVFLYTDNNAVQFAFRSSSATVGKFRTRQEAMERACLFAELIALNGVSCSLRDKEGTDIIASKDLSPYNGDDADTQRTRVIDDIRSLYPVENCRLQSMTPTRMILYWLTSNRVELQFADIQVVTVYQRGTSRHEYEVELESESNCIRTSRTQGNAPVGRFEGTRGKDEAMHLANSLAALVGHYGGNCVVTLRLEETRNEKTARKRKEGYKPGDSVRSNSWEGVSGLVIFLPAGWSGQVIDKINDNFYRVKISQEKDTEYFEGRSYDMSVYDFVPN